VNKVGFGVNDLQNSRRNPLTGVVADTFKAKSVLFAMEKPSVFRAFPPLRGVLQVARVTHPRPSLRFGPTKGENWAEQGILEMPRGISGSYRSAAWSVRESGRTHKRAERAIPCKHIP